MKLRRYKVPSGNIDWVAYNVKSEELFVRFASGGLYRYDAVPPSRVAYLMFEESIGSYFAKHVRNDFTATKLDPAPMDLFEAEVVA